MKSIDGEAWKTVLAQLSARFPAGEVKERPGRGSLKFSYIDARAVEDRLDEVVGPDNWTDEYIEFGSGAEHVIKCSLTVHEITKTGIGYPNGPNDDEPLKAAESDALKRAAVKFGIGRFLYTDGHGPKPTIETRTQYQGVKGRKTTRTREELAGVVSYLKNLTGLAPGGITEDAIAAVRKAGGTLADDPAKWTPENYATLYDAVTEEIHKAEMAKPLHRQNAPTATA